MASPMDGLVRANSLHSFKNRRQMQRVDVVDLVRMQRKMIMAKVQERKDRAEK